MKNPVKEKMETASLRELMPDFDKNAEWQHLSAQLTARRKRIRLSWRLAAAAVLMLCVSAIFLVPEVREHILPAGNEGITQKDWATEIAPPIEPATTVTPVTAENMAATANTTGDINENTTPPPSGSKSTIPARNNHTKEFICNGTPCPLEICIIQTIHCGDGHPVAFSTCSVLEPDQARQLHYKTPDTGGEHCKVTIDEIRIKRVNTGETIVLNSSSQPATAEELFDCIMGKEKCNLLAGIFHTDCNNQEREHSLKVDDKWGDVIVQ